MTSRSRLPGLDGLRGLAALGVVALHAWMYCAGRGDVPAWPLVDGIVGELRLGLVYFFVASGFLLARPWVRAALDGAPPPGLSRFARHRAARIVPGYLVALVGAFAVLAGSGHPREVGVAELPVFALFAQNQVGSTAGQLNPPTWSLAVEVGFYLVLPLIGWAFLRARTRVGMLAVCAAVAAGGCAWCAAGWFGAWPMTTMTSPPTFVAVFACGVAASVLAHGRAPRRGVAGGLIVAGALLVVANGWWHAAGDTGALGHTLRDVPAAIGFAAVAAGLCARPPGVLDVAPLRWLGDISYGVYLWHMPVLYWLITHDVFPAGFVAAFALVAIPAIALGAASWIAVERPALRAAGGRRTCAREPRTAPAAGAARAAPAIDVSSALWR